MAIPILLVILLPTLSFQPSSSTSSITRGFSLSVEKPEDIIVSSNGMFTAGFYAVGENAYSFAVWFNKPHGNSSNSAVIWMANRDQPVNGKRSSLSLQNSGNLILNDAGQFNVWATNTVSSMASELTLKNNGNLVLREIRGLILWQSFDFPTDTLVPGQELTRFAKLVSSRSKNNHSSGFYKLFFNDNNILNLVYDGRDVSSVFWPDPWSVSWEVGRSTYNSSRIAVLDVFGNFSSSDEFSFKTSDYGTILQRRLKIDHDGNLRVYSRKNGDELWRVSWQAKTETCRIHGICGANSICSYHHKQGRKCSCIPGHGVKNDTDWSYGCEPLVHLSCKKSDSDFLKLKDVEFYGYDYHYVSNYTYNQCKDLCLELCNCKGFQYSFDRGQGHFDCYTKTLLLNGQRSPGFRGTTYLRIPKGKGINFDEEESVRICNVTSVEVQREYVKRQESSFVKFFLWFACAIGALEVLCISTIWCYIFRSRTKSIFDQEGYRLTATGFRKFTYSELKDATRGFNQEIGRGAGGIVYKGVLSDERIAAIKRLNDANSQGEGEFLAEVSIIGRLNHMNLIEMWGYCAEGKHRLLVYEYMENGSLADNLLSKKLDWAKRYEIALGMARGLAYLHEECLEWILHCDIKPQNILLDSNYQPKVADFGLSKLLQRNNLNNSSFSTIRGTRGYMAPEWLFNLPISSKVDVYSYGIVVLEMLTGKSSTMEIQIIDGVEAHHGRLVTWVREKRSKRSEMASWVTEIIDPVIVPNCDVRKMETLARVALDCVEEDKDVRPTMSQEVEMLQGHENDV